MRKQRFALTGTDLALRTAAREERSRLLELIERRGPVILDLTGVESISGPYADELFGVPAQHFGFDWVISHIKVVGARESILRIIAEAIHERSKGERRPVAVV